MEKLKGKPRPVDKESSSRPTGYKSGCRSSLITLTSIFKLLTQALRIFLNNSWLGVDDDEVYNIFFNESTVETRIPSDDSVHD